jgi:hypothetical protein
MKKSLPLLLLIMLSMAGMPALAQKNSGIENPSRRNYSQNKLQVKSFLGPSYANAGNSFEYQNTVYALEPEPGVTGGMHFLFHSRNGIFINNRLLLSYDRHKTDTEQISFLVMSYYLNPGYAFNRFISLEAGVGINVPLYLFSSGSSFKNTSIEGSPFVYDFGLSLSLGERTGLDLLYSAPFNKRQLWLRNDSYTGNTKANDYRPVIISLCFTFQIGKVQRLLTDQSGYSIF